MDQPDMTEALQQLVEKYSKQPQNCITKSNDNNPYFG